MYSSTTFPLVPPITLPTSLCCQMNELDEIYVSFLMHRHDVLFGAFIGPDFFSLFQILQNLCLERIQIHFI